jgi:hypothetical protein
LLKKVKITHFNIEFSGVSRRGDFEVLLFNLIDWLGGKLPWDREPQPKPRVIHELKANAFNDVAAFLAQCFKAQPFPGNHCSQWAFCRGTVFVGRSLH